MVEKLRDALPFALPFARGRCADEPYATHVSDREADPAHPLVHPLVVGGGHFAWTESPMPPSALVHCLTQNGYFHGFCGHVGGTRLTVRGAALRGLEHAQSRTEGRDAAGALWNGRHRLLCLAAADGRGSGPADASRRTVVQVLEMAAAGEIDSGFLHRHKGSITVTAAVVRPQPKGASVQVLGAEGEAWLLTPGGWHVLRAERTGGYPVPAGSVVVLGSDGFIGALAHNTRLTDELALRWRTPPTPLEFLAQLDFFDGYRTGDRAAAAVWIG